MKIISFIEEIKIIEMILRHLGFWDIRNHDPSALDPIPIPENVARKVTYTLTFFLTNINNTNDIIANTRP